MIDTKKYVDTNKYENMRLLFLDFIDTASDEVDEKAWRDKLTMLDELLAEVEWLRDRIRRMRHWAEPKMHEVHHDAWRKLHEEIYEGDD